MKKKLALFIFAVLCIAGYFLLYHKDKKLQYVPQNADVIALIDVKNVTRHYLLNYVQHPSEWFKKTESTEEKIKLKNSGIVIPDFFQIFHLKETSFNQWFSILEIKNQKQFLAFLTQEGFKEIEKNSFLKGNIYLTISQGKCIVGLGNFKSNSNFLSFVPSFQNSKNFKTFSSDQFIDDSHGSLSFLSGSEIQNFGVELKNHSIEIKNNKKTEILDALFSSLQNQKELLAFEVGKEELQNVQRFFRNKNQDSLSVTSAKGTAFLEEVKEKVVTYEYDENFNEVEKVAYQKIVQPQYLFSITTENNENAFNYFQQKKWINAQQQFTMIPFQPNNISMVNQEIVIKSLKKTPKPILTQNKNYVFFKNNPLLLSSFKSFSQKEKEAFSDLDFVFYGREQNNIFLKIGFTEKELPLILRF